MESLLRPLLTSSNLIEDAADSRADS